MKEQTQKTHRDYVDIIGGTAFTTRNYREKRWNQYYFGANKRVVRMLLENENYREAILDVGCSHGSWFKTWKELGFELVHGVEMSAERAEQARLAGFDLVYNCEAGSIPVEDSSYQIACSSSMFIHVLQLRDKLEILNEMYRILKPGGVFIFNFPPPNSQGYTDDTINKYCSWYTLDTMMREVIIKSKFIIEDIKPTYYPPYSKFRTLVGYAITLPFAVSLLRIHDVVFSRNFPIHSSSGIYFKLRKRFMK